MTANSVIDVEHLDVFYGEFHAAKDLSFRVAKGELYALLGTNGAGKTTALEVVEGHRQATSGRVRVFGHDPRDFRSVRPRTGIMLQESGFAPDLTVKETVGLIGGLSKRADDPDRVIGVAGLTSKAGVRVTQLSGGEKRRLDFATAIYGSPELIFLDEPTTGLDVQSRDHFWETIDRLRTDGATVVLTTHYLEEAEQRADRIGLMHNGRLHMQGTLTELTRLLPSSITFSIPRHAPEPPFENTIKADGKHVIETHELQRDLHALLDWAERLNVGLGNLEAGPSQLDSVFRSVAHDRLQLATSENGR